MSSLKLTKPELLAPAGNFEKMQVAFHYGADAVYIGLKKFSLRAKAKNYEYDEVRNAINYAHSIHKKIYIALNIYFTPDESDQIIDILSMLESIKPDGIILADIGALYLSKKHAPSIPIHISTQANTTNQYAVKQYEELGVERIILARELTLKNIKIIQAQTNIQLEAFIHGAMCIAYSGRCLLSSYMTHPNLGKRKNDKSTEIRSANKGNCVHTCRWEYFLKEKSRPDQTFEIDEDETGSYIFSSKDICMVNNIEDLINAGINSFKIEGRIKSILYIASIISVYRRAIDYHFDRNLDYYSDIIQNELNSVSHREFSTGFFYDSPQQNANTTKGGVYKRTKRLAAMVLDNNKEKAKLKIYNALNIDMQFEYMGKNLNILQVKINFFNENGNPTDQVKHGQDIQAELFTNTGEKIVPQEFDIIRVDANF